MNFPIARSLVPIALVLACTIPALASPHAGDVAPTFSVPSDRGGSPIDIGKFKGKALYVNFFASWCGPCNDEAPDVRRLYSKYKNRGFVTVGIDELENAQTAQAFAKKYGWPFAIGVDADGKAIANYASFGLPVHVFIDRNGKISTYRLGQMDPGEIEDAIKKTL